MWNQGKIIAKALHPETTSKSKVKPRQTVFCVPFTIFCQTRGLLGSSHFPNLNFCFLFFSLFFGSFGYRTAGPFFPSAAPTSHGRHDGSLPHPAGSPGAASTHGRYLANSNSVASWGRTRRWRPSLRFAGLEVIFVAVYFLGGVRVLAVLNLQQILSFPGEISPQPSASGDQWHQGRLKVQAMSQGCCSKCLKRRRQGQQRQRQQRQQEDEEEEEQEEQEQRRCSCSCFG